MSNIPITEPAPEVPGGSMSKIPITAPSPQASGEAVGDVATPRRSSLIGIVTLAGIVGVVLVITLGPWRDSPSTDDTKVAATISVPVTSPAGTLATPEVVVAVAGEDVVGEPVVTDRSGCGRPDVWVQVCDAESFGEAAMYAVAAGGPGLVAVGVGVHDCCPDSEYSLDQEQLAYEQEPSYEADGNPAADAVAWTSVDGVTWSLVPHDEEVFGGPGEQRMVSVTAGGPGLVAVGSERRFDRQGNAAVWTSVDGLTWSRVRHDEAVFGGPGEQRIDGVTVGGPGLVAVGSATRQMPADDNVPADDRDFDIYEAAVWTSVDGLTWSRVPDADVVAVSDDEPEAMLSVTAGGPGLVAVGGDSKDNQCGFRYEAVWTSPDGLTWSQLPDRSPCGGEASNDLRMISVTVGGSGLVAVGWDVKGAAVWNG
jgi:hypothetical protein